MHELWKYLKDPRFIVPAAAVLLFELVLRTGVYERALEPNSYAANVRNIMHTAETTRLEPNVLILGTSVPYQGVQLPYLNELLADTGLVVQSGACQGCMIETQYMLYRQLKEKYPRLKAVVHVGETALAWKARYESDVANRSMLARFPASEVIPLQHRLGYRLQPWDYAYYFVKTFSLQADLRDLLLSPLKRIKSIGRYERKRLDDYAYVNEHEYAISAFGADDLQECVQETARPRPELVEAGLTDRHHQNATLQTCQIALWEKGAPPTGGPQWNELFFDRLDKFYDEIYADGRLTVTVFPPYSDLVDHLNEDKRKAVWERNLAEIHGDRPYFLLDMRRSLDGPNNQDYYYDLLHLNAEGARRWTEQIARELRALAPVILSQADPAAQ